jgi:hypothetical protein
MAVTILFRLRLLRIKLHPNMFMASLQINVISSIHTKAPKKNTIKSSNELFIKPPVKADI